MDDLRIKITGALNTNTTAKEINTQLGALQSKIDKLNLSIKIDDKIFNTLKNFATQMEKISDVAKNTGKVIQESINPDGSRTKLTFFNGLKGEFSEVTKSAKDSAKAQLASLDEVIQGYDKVTRSIEKYNATQKKIGEKVTYTDQNGINSRAINLNNKGQVLGYTDTTNYAKQDQQATKLSSELETLRQKLVVLGQTGNVTEKQLEKVNSVINGASSLEGLNQARQAYAQLADTAKLAEQMAQGREKATLSRMQSETKASQAQQQAIQRNLDLDRQEQQAQRQLEAEIQRRLVLYQREKQLQATNLTSRYGNNINQTALNNQLSSIMNVSPNQFGSLRELTNWQQEANLGFRQLTSGMDNMTHHAMSFGDAIQQAFQKFPVWLISGTAIMQTVNFFKEGVAAVNELNASLTQISIVTGKNQQQVGALGEQYNKLGQNLGVTTSELSQTAAGLYRAGLSTDQVKSRMEIVTKYAKISSLDTQTASEIMMAAINSMHVSATRAADVWSLLGDATATGADEIGKAMQKVGGTAGALGKMNAQLKFLLIGLETLTYSRGRQGASVMVA